jgi:hypothetical protein
MPAVSTRTQGKAHPMRGYIWNKMQAGAEREEIVVELGKSGVEEGMARNLVESVYQESLNGPIESVGTAPSLQLPILGGLLTSVVAGFIWGGIIIVTGWELGIVAWAVGAAVAYGVLMFSKGEAGSPQQIIAVGCSILGMLIGKYFAFYTVLKEMVTQELGPETAGQMSVFSFELFGKFLTNMGEVLGAFDLLWIILACISAYKIVDASGE